MIAEECKSNRKLKVQQPLSKSADDLQTKKVFGEDTGKGVHMVTAFP